MNINPEKYLCQSVIPFVIAKDNNGIETIDVPNVKQEAIKQQEIKEISKDRLVIGVLNA